MSTSTSQPTETSTSTRAGAPDRRPDPGRWLGDGEAASERAPRTFDPGSRRRLPNTVSAENQATPR